MTKRAALAALLLLARGMAPAADGGGTAGAADEASRLAELERAFWFCDYKATTEGVLATPIAACRYATEELQRARFNDDFDAFLSWWRENKRAEHLKQAGALSS